MPVLAQAQVDQIEPRPATGIRRNSAQGRSRVPDQGKDLPGWDRDVVQKGRPRHGGVAARVVEWHLPLVRPVDEDRPPGKGIAVWRPGHALVAASGTPAARKRPGAGPARRNAAGDTLGGPGCGRLGELSW